MVTFEFDHLYPVHVSMLNLNEKKTDRVVDIPVLHVQTCTNISMYILYFSCYPNTMIVMRTVRHVMTSYRYWHLYNLLQLSSVSLTLLGVCATEY